MALHPRLCHNSQVAKLKDWLFQMVLDPHVAPGPLVSAMAKAEQEGRAKTMSMPRWLEAVEDAAPVHEKRNAEHRKEFECDDDDDDVFYLFFQKQK
jgi:hypothetical protein